MKQILLVFIAIASCNTVYKKEKIHSDDKSQQVINKNCQEKAGFSALENLDGVFNSKNDSIPFFLTYKKDTCYFAKGIKFHEVNLMLKSKNYLSFSFGLGIKNDSIFTSSIYNDYPYVEDIQYFFSNKETRYPKKPTMLRSFFPRIITLDSIYLNKEEKIFRFDSFFDMPHEQPSKYEIHKLYISKERGIFKVDILDQETKEIFSTIETPGTRKRS